MVERGARGQAFAKRTFRPGVLAGRASHGHSEPGTAFVGRPTRPAEMSRFNFQRFGAIFGLGVQGLV